MDSATDLETWNRLLADLESFDSKNILKVITELTALFNHLSLQAAPRHQREYDSCNRRSNELLGTLFDDIDLSDKPLLCSFLAVLRSYGYFRLAQIAYHVEESDTDPIYSPIIEKVKWYDLSPLLPKAGTIGWKSIMNHGLVKEERQLLQACLKLLSQKLHFYSIVSLMSSYQDSAHIQRNGKKVAEKLFELIRDVAYDDECMIGLDTSLFNLLLPFTNENQQAAIIDAIVQDLFKPLTQQRPISDEEIIKTYDLIDSCVMSKSHLQELFITGLLEHLKCNIVGRKRRHSFEAAQENSGVTLESLLDCNNKGTRLVDLLERIDGVEISAKLRPDYPAYWIGIVEQILLKRNLTSASSLRILGTCSILLVTTSNVISQNLASNLSSLMAKTIEDIGLSRLDKFFSSCDPSFLIELTKALSKKTQVVSTFDVSMQQFYKTYLNRYLSYSISRGSKPIEKFRKFVTSICDKSLNRDASHLLQCICIHELASCLNIIKNRGGNKVLEIYMDCARVCCKRLHKFIKRNSFLKIDSENEIGEEMDTSELNCSSELVLKLDKVIMVDALVCILRIALDRQDQEILDSYGDLLSKLFNVVKSRVEKLVKITQTGKSEASTPIDPYLPKLMDIYIDHENTIKAYLDIDLVDTVSSLLIIDEPLHSNGSLSVEKKGTKKTLYVQIKTKLEALAVRADKSMNVYPTIISKQYSSVVDQSIGSIGDIKREKSCFHNYWHQMKTLKEVSATILSNCDFDTYGKALSNVVLWLEKCDPLDHTRVLYLFVLLESLISRHDLQVKDQSAFLSFKEVLPRISCSLIRISKSVQLGPSIHAFTRAGAHRSNRGVQCCTYAKCIKIYTLIFLKCPPKITNSLITDAMQICISANLMQYAKHCVILNSFFIQLASAIAGLLKSICIGRKEEEVIKSSMPVFLSVFSLLIRCLILASDHQKLEMLSRPQINGHSAGSGDGGCLNDDDDDPDHDDIRKDYETQLELLAMDVGRTLNNLSSLRVKMVDYAPNLISTYLKDIQRAPCPDFVRLHLDEGIFRIFNLVDAHQKERQEEVIEAGVQRKTVAGRASGSLFEMIHARLDQASREIFRDMHDNYNRFHRYRGKC